MSNGKSRRRLSLDSVKNLTQSFERRKGTNGYESDTSPHTPKRSSIFQKLVTPGKSSRRASVAGVELAKNSKESNSLIANKATGANTQLYARKPAKVLPYQEKASILECVRFLNEEPHALEVEGIFRISGSFSQMQKLRARLKQGYGIPRGSLHNKIDPPDPLTVADLLKDLLRNLESPILPKETGRRLLSTNTSSAGLGLLHIIDKLTEDNKEVFEKLMQLLAKTSSLSLFNHMNSTNIATIFAPTLINWDPLQPAARNELLAVTEAVKSIIDDYVSSCSDTERKGLKTRKYHSMPLHLQPNPFYNPPKHLEVSKLCHHDSEKENRFDEPSNIRACPKIRDSRRPKEILQWRPLTDEERTSFDASFHAVDIRDKGCISASEGITFLGKFNLSLEQVALIWNLVDRDDSGVLGIREWRVAMALCMGLNRNCQIPTKLPAVLEQELHEPDEDSFSAIKACGTEIENCAYRCTVTSSDGNLKTSQSAKELPEDVETSQKILEGYDSAISKLDTVEENCGGHVREQPSCDEVLESIRWLWTDALSGSKVFPYKSCQEMPFLDPLARRKLLGRGFHG